MEKNKTFKNKVERFELMVSHEYFNLNYKTGDTLFKPQMDALGKTVHAKYIWTVDLNKIETNRIFSIGEEEIEITNIINGVVMAMGDKITEDAIKRALQEYAGIIVESVEIKGIIKTQSFKIQLGNSTAEYVSSTYNVFQNALENY